MLSFIHHKSTGDMLAEFATGGANLAATTAKPTSVNRSSSNITVVKRATQKRQRNQHQQRKQQQPPVRKRKQQVYTSLQVNEYRHEKEDYKDENEEDDEDEDEDEEEELKRKPLLLSSCEDELVRRSSTKYLTGSVDGSNRCASSNGRATTEQQVTASGNRWSLQRQFKSIGDFLADTANIWPSEQRQQSVEPHLNSSSTPVVVAVQPDNERPASSSSSSSSSSLLSVDVESGNQLLRSAPPPPVAVPELDEPNGAQKRPLQRRRRAAMYAAARSNHRLSLSSPMLSQQQQQPYEMNSSNDRTTNKAAAKLENLRKGQQQVGKDHDDTGGETKLAHRYDRFQCIVVANDHDDGGDDDDDRQDSSAQSSLSSSSGCYSTCNEDAVATTTTATGGGDLSRKERETQQQNQVSNSIDNHLMSNVETAAAAAAIHCGCLTCEQSQAVVIEPSHEREKSCPINIMPLLSHQKRLRHPIQQAVNRQQLADIQKCGSEQSNNVSNASNSNNNNSNNNNNNNSYDNNSQRVATTTTANDCTAQQVAALANGQQSQTGGGTVHHNQQHQQPNHLSTTGSLMVDLNCIASKLISVPGQSLRQALQPSHSGSYKVCSLEQQQVSASGQQQVLAQQQREWTARKLQQQQQQQENSSNVLLTTTTATTTTDKEYARETREHTTTKRNASAANNLLQQTTRISRPGRSPVSLQRQTNARLAKHRLRIQQQRQEQLEQLAQRERLQLNDRQQQQRSSFGANRQQQVPSSQSLELSNQSQDRVNINSCQTIGQSSNINNSSNVSPAAKTLQVASSFLQESVQLFNGLRDKLSLNNINNSNFALPNNHQLFTNENNHLQSQPTQVRAQTQDTSSLEAIITNSRLAPQQHRRYQQQQHRLQSNLNPIQSHQVITPTTSRAFEICDNQLAGCSSRLDRNTVRSTINNSNNNSNVIAYNPINMMRPVQNSFNQSSSRQHLCHNHQLSNGSSRRHHSSSRAAGHNNNNSNHHHYCQQTSAKCDAADEVIVEEEASKSEMDNRRSDSASSSSLSSNASSSLSLNKPFCKICHMGSSKIGDKLISPCRCSGTMQYIHCGCLLKWLEISNRTNEKPMSCELCAHEYTWHKKFNYRRMQMPKCSLKDILLHVIFIAAVGVMFMSALAPMLHKKSAAASVISSSPQQQSPPSSSGSLHKAQSNSDSANEINGVNNGRNNRHHMSIPIHHSSSFNGQSNHLVTGGRLASDEKFMLLCAASFFISFFLAIYVQTKARDTLYGLFVKFLTMNQTFYITEYDHGQLNGSGANSNNNNINNGTVSNSGGSSNTSGDDINIKHQYQQQHQNHHQQHQQQYHNHSQPEQQFYSVNSRPDRKSSVKS